MAATAVMAEPRLNSLSCMTSFTIVICNPLGVWEILESNPYRRVAFLSGKGSALGSHPFLAQASGGRYFPLGHKTGTLIRIRKFARGITSAACSREEPLMAASNSSSQLRFEPPGPGSWKQDPVHFPRPMTLYWQEMHPPAFKKGTNDFARFYGMLIDGLECAYVNGFGYNRVLPAPEAEFPERFKRAEQVFAQKLWRQQLTEWDEKHKPSTVATQRQLQAVDPDALSEVELATYLTRCRDHHSAMIAQHMRFTAGAILPTGDFLAHVGDWTGLPHAELLGLMRGSAEVSAGGSEEMQRLKKA